MPRKKLVVDGRMQGGLVLRVVAYWLFSLVAVGLILLSWNIAQGPSGPYFSPSRFDDLWKTYASMIVASALVLPVLLADVLLIGNRYVGPVSRMRQNMRALAAGEPGEPIRFGKRDPWSGLAGDFNTLIEYVERLRAESHAGAVAEIAAGNAGREIVLAGRTGEFARRNEGADPLESVAVQ